ncbi:MAG TPA: beta-ketoacyl synthase N-terminal-like domain-containing protein, partial [bacterium]|nr:beta-ketoacyl synthase N-terminal-like domain-containing protein [bacterium]
MKNKKDIVITGMGNITPLGNTVPTAWNNLVNGKNGVGLIESFDVSNFSTRIGAEVKDFTLDIVDKKSCRRMD